MKATAGVFAFTLLVSALMAGTSQAQTTPSRCADCHFANPRSVSRWHLSEWDHSAHGRASVGCEKCHGGDPSTFESFLAHQGILSARNPASPVNRINLPKTCGACHPGPFAAFQKSRHYELLREGNPDTPTCVTCHGNVGAFLLSPSPSIRSARTAMPRERWPPGRLPGRGQDRAHQRPGGPGFPRRGEDVDQAGDGQGPAGKPGGRARGRPDPAARGGSLRSYVRVRPDAGSPFHRAEAGGDAHRAGGESRPSGRRVRLP